MVSAIGGDLGVALGIRGLPGRLGGVLQEKPEFANDRGGAR